MLVVFRLVRGGIGGIGGLGFVCIVFAVVEFAFSLSVDEVSVVWGELFCGLRRLCGRGIFLVLFGWGLFIVLFSASFGLWVSVGGGILGL